MKYTDPSGMVLQPSPNPADAGYPYNPEAAAWLANYYSQSFGGSGGGGDSPWVNSFLDYSHSCFENGGEASTSVFNFEMNKQTNSPGNNGTVTIQTGTIDYYTFTSTDGGKTWHQGNYINSKPIFSTIQVGQANTLYTIGVGLNAAGFVSSAGEYSNVINGSWRGVNGKWNSLEWGGNVWTGARANALSKASYFKLASRGLFFIGSGISLYQGGYDLINGNYAGAAKSGLDIGMGALATFGGPPGWIIGGGYFLFDALGAFSNHPMIASPYIILPNIAVPDNTYVAPRIIRYP